MDPVTPGNLALAIWTLLAQTLVFGIGLACLVRLALAAIAPGGASTRFAVWFATLVAIAVFPLALIVRNVSNQQPAAAATASSPIAIHASAATLSASTQPAPQPAPLNSGGPRSRALQIPVDSDLIAGFLGAAALISILLLMRLGVSYLRIRRMRRATQPAPPELTERFQHWLTLCPTARPVQLMLSSKARSPMAIGFRKPAVIIPDTLLLQLTTAELDHLGLHEVAHIRRADDWTNLIQRVIQAVFFFNPAVHWICDRLNFEREVACDDWVLTLSGPEPKPYARSLTRILEAAPARHRGPLLASGAVFRKRQIFKRIELLLDKTRDIRPGISPLTFVVLLMCVAGAFSQMMLMPGFVNFHDIAGVGNQSTWRWSNGGRTVEMRMRGEVQFTPDFRSVASISPGGSLDLREGAELSWLTPPRRELEILPGLETGSPVQLRYLIDGRERTIDATAREWAAGLMLHIVRESAIQVEERVASILASGGPAAILREIDLIGSDHSRHQYLTAAIRSGALSLEEMRRAVISAGRIGSDHDKANLLIDIASLYATTPVLRSAWFDAVNTLRSDHDHRRVLEAAIAEADVNNEFLTLVGRSVERMSSDHDKSEVLRTPALLAACPGETPNPGCVALVRAAGSIRSDHDKANVLSSLATKPATPTDLDAVRSISSDIDKRRVLEAMLKSPSATLDTAKNVVSLATSIQSDHDKAEVLGVVVEKYGENPEVRAAVKKAAEKISSDSDYRRLVSRIL